MKIQFIVIKGTGFVQPGEEMASRVTWIPEPTRKASWRACCFNKLKQKKFSPDEKVFYHEES